MPMYFYRGTFAPELKTHILENARNFEAIMRGSIEAFGGKLDVCFLSATSAEPIGFVEFKNDLDARSWNLFYGSQHGVTTSDLESLIDYGELQKIAKRVNQCSEKATQHRRL
ncbi:MAG: hypothetical protein MRJ68_06115 [Nitrospira sp.]|nr:hypothetical protein [Nitrospira sp.]